MTREVRFQRTSAALLGLFVTALAGSASASSPTALNTPAGPTAAPTSSLAQDALRYVQSGSKGSKIRNVPDPAIRAERHQRNCVVGRAMPVRRSTPAQPVAAQHFPIGTAADAANDCHIGLS